jgi:hypothetical protein
LKLFHCSDIVPLPPHLHFDFEGNDPTSERFSSQILNKREERRERSPQEGGQEEEGVEAHEKESNMDLEEEREYSSMMPGNIRNLAKETTPKNENETP